MKKIQFQLNWIALKLKCPELKIELNWIEIEIELCRNWDWNWTWKWNWIELEINLNVIKNELNWNPTSNRIEMRIKTFNWYSWFKISVFYMELLLIEQKLNWIETETKLITQVGINFIYMRVYIFTCSHSGWWWMPAKNHTRQL